MSSKGDDLEKWGADVISGRDRSFLAFVMRRVLGVFSILFRVIVTIRVKNFLSGRKEQADFATMVVSVGNLTVGGTGKTPIVEKLVTDLHQCGRQVAILSRGYKSKPLKKPQEWEGISRDEAYDIMPRVVSDHHKIHLKPPYSGDEPYMLAKNLPGVAVIVGKDRVKSADFALKYLGSDTLVLDDGMQYLKLRHKYDIVLVDQNSPFGTEALLPRGTLREPPKQLKRADFIIITKCKEPTSEELIARIRKYNSTAEIMQCRHEAVELENLFTGERKPLDFLNDKHVTAISGIAVPESFENLLKKHGAKILFHRTFSDHHNFTQKEIDRFMERSFRRDANLIITTEKDAVRFLRPTELDTDVYFLRIEIKVLEGQEAWNNAINTICGGEHLHPVDYGIERVLDGVK